MIIRPMLRGTTALASAFLFVAAVPALARDDDRAAEDVSDQGVSASTDGGAVNQIEEVVVVGRKRARAEELQSTPMSITALSAAQLQRSTTRDLSDVGRLTPNASLQPSSQKGVQNFSIRGTGVSGTTPSDEPAVGIFQDGVYWGTNYGALGELLDLEGVEILRGPQGTLFGRNVTGGAVTFRSARPNQQAYQRYSLGVSNGLGVDGSAVVNGGLTDSLSARLALSHRYNAGLFTKETLNKSSLRRD